MMFEPAIALIESIPGYTATAMELRDLERTGKLRFVPTLNDRGNVSWYGWIRVGPEPFREGILSVAETLIHELHHRHQPPYLKTVSFWQGVFLRTPVWQRLERPAYQAAYDFLEAVAQHCPEHVKEARREQKRLVTAFCTFYKSEW